MKQSKPTFKQKIGAHPINTVRKSATAVAKQNLENLFACPNCQSSMAALSELCPDCGGMRCRMYCAACHTNWEYTIYVAEV